MRSLILVCAILGALAHPAAAQVFGNPKINLTVTPATAKIFRLDETGYKVQLGTGSAVLELLKNNPNEVVVEAEGYEPVRATFPREQKHPKTITIPMPNRVVKITAVPYDAQILQNGTVKGRESAEILVPEGKSVTVELKKPYCNQDNMVAPPPEEHFQLLADESFSNSVQSDLANVNFTVEVGRGKTEEQAWKLISQIVMSHFDLLEITDRETGYLRTNWVVKNFPHRTVRTRFIVKLGDTTPLKYVVKIASERSRYGLTDVKANEDFEEWSRILNDYRYIIDEIQARLR